MDYLYEKFQTGQGAQLPEPTWNAVMGRYEFHSPEGTLCVDGDVYSEAIEQAKKDHPVSGSHEAIALYKSLDELDDWTVWSGCVDGKRVYYLER